MKCPACGEEITYPHKCYGVYVPEKPWAKFPSNCNHCYCQTIYRNEIPHGLCCKCGDTMANFGIRS